MIGPVTQASKSAQDAIADKKRRILVADEDEFVSSLISKVLSRYMGLEVVKVRDGSEAIAVALAGNYDAAIIGMVLPQTSGLKVIRTIKTMRPEFPIIATSTEASEKSLKSIERFGVTAVLTKPFKMAELIQKVKCALSANEKTSAPK
jgi:CheY-like chemotaxis protein